MEVRSISEVRNLIAKARTKKALDYLEQICKTNKYKIFSDQIILLKNQYHSYKQREIEGIGTSRKTISRINKSILEILKEIEKVYISSVKFEIVINKEKESIKNEVSYLSFKQFHFGITEVLKDMIIEMLLNHEILLKKIKATTSRAKELTDHKKYNKEKGEHYFDRLEFSMVLQFDMILLEEYVGSLSKEIGEEILGELDRFSFVTLLMGKLLTIYL